jgi:hypothetical protein
MEDDDDDEQATRRDLEFEASRQRWRVAMLSDAELKWRVLAE